MSETVIITGRQLDVQHRRDDDNEPLRRRPATYVPTEPTGVDLAELIAMAALFNPWWSDKANNWADAHPNVRPKDAAKEWRKHRIENPHDS